MTLHQPFYNMDQQVLHELYLTWILAGAFILLCVATLIVISKISKEHSPSKDAQNVNKNLAYGIYKEIIKSNDL